VTTTVAFEELPVPRRWLGFAGGLGAALCFALGSCLAPLVYEDGASPQAIVAVRLSLILPALFIFTAATKRPILLPRRERLIALGLGVLSAFGQLCFYMAISLIPVSLAILVEFVYQVIVLVAMRIFFREALTPLKLAVIGVALCGLFFALNVRSTDGLLSLGVLFAFGSAVAVASKMILSGVLLRSFDVVRLLLHMHLAGVLIFWALFTVTGQMQMPGSLQGWAALAAMALLNGAGTLMSLLAIRTIGPLRTAVAQTGEPMFTITLAIILLGEVLTAQRAFGAVLIIGAILALQLARARATR
jgi:drug/metabolite transporter (DMT)-like permease